MTPEQEDQYIAWRESEDPYMRATVRAWTRKAYQAALDSKAGGCEYPTEDCPYLKVGRTCNGDRVCPGAEPSSGDECPVCSTRPHPEVAIDCKCPRCGADV